MDVEDDWGAFLCPSPLHHNYNLSNVIGRDFLVEASHLDHCNISNSIRLINVVCTYVAKSSATGLLVITQRDHSNEVHKLYINQTTHQQNSVSIEVEMNGVYLVSIIPILEGIGIINSSVEHREMIQVEALRATGRIVTEKYRIIILYRIFSI